MPTHDSYDSGHFDDCCKFHTTGLSEWCNAEEAVEEMTVGVAEAAWTIFCNGFGPRHVFHEWLHALPKDREEAELLDQLES